MPANRLEQDLAKAVQTHLTARIDRGDIAGTAAHGIERLRSEAVRLGDRALDVVRNATLGEGTIAIALDPCKLANALQMSKDSISPEALSLQLPFMHRRRGVETRLIIGAAQPARDDILIANVARASIWRDALCNGDDLATIAARDGITVKYLGQMLAFAFLSPKLVRAILEGRQSSTLTTNWIRRHDMPASWAEQDRVAAQL